MKYLVPCLLFLPFITGCTVIEDQYYEPEYYSPPPRVVIEPSYHHRHYPHRVYREVPRVRVYHHHGQHHRNVVVGNPNRTVQQNVHGHASGNAVVHSPTDHSPQSNNSTHGHGEVVKSRPSTEGDVEVQKTVHQHH